LLVFENSSLVVFPGWGGEIYETYFGKNYSMGPRSGIMNFMVKQPSSSQKKTPKSTSARQRLHRLKLSKKELLYSNVCRQRYRYCQQGGVPEGYRAKRGAVKERNVVHFHPRLPGHGTMMMKGVVLAKSSKLFIVKSSAGKLLALMRDELLDKDR
jgi:hypothetical protein